MNYFIKNIKILFLYILVYVSIFIIVDGSSIFAYFYSLLIILIFNKLVQNKSLKFSWFSFHYYSLFAIIVYLINKYQLPEFIGLTGPEGIGTDDYTFYGQIVDGNVPYTMEIPAEYKYPYSLFMKAVYPFDVHTPLNLCIFNSMVVSYLPYYTGKISMSLFNNEKIANLSKLLIMICPMTTIYGVIIIRDLLVTTLVMASIYYMLERKLIPLLICISVVFFVRFGSLSFLISSLLIIIINRMLSKRRGLLWVRIFVTVVIVLFIILFPTLQEISQGKLGSSLIRSVEGDYFTGSTIAKLVSLPLPFNIIMSTLFFIFAPIFTFPSNIDGIVPLISISNATLTPIFFIGLFPFIINATLSVSKDKKSIILLLVLTLAFAVILGTVSLQIRHKNIIYPLYSVIAAYGFYNYDKKNHNNTIMVFIVIIFFELSYATLSVLSSI